MNIAKAGIGVWILISRIRRTRHNQTSIDKLPEGSTHTEIS